MEDPRDLIFVDRNSLSACVRSLNEVRDVWARKQQTIPKDMGDDDVCVSGW